MTARAHHHLHRHQSPRPSQSSVSGLSHLKVKDKKGMAKANPMRPHEAASSYHIFTNIAAIEIEVTSAATTSQPYQAISRATSAHHFKSSSLRRYRHLHHFHKDCLTKSSSCFLQIPRMSFTGAISDGIDKGRVACILALVGALGWA